MPRIQYRNEAGKRLPGTTTVGGAFKPSIEGLLVWANRLGQDGKDLDDGRNTATEPGTLAHSKIDAYLHGQDPEAVDKGYPQDVIDKAQNSYLNFHHWAKNNELKPVSIEPNLVSEQYQYGGTPDLIARLHGKLAIVDWKTGRVYESVLLQLAAYNHLWFENHGEHFEAFHILQIPRNADMPSFTHRFWGHLPDEAWACFEKLLSVYADWKTLKKFIS